MLTAATIEVENLTKRYGDVEALRGVSFSVGEGEVFGLLGPNGAGKTSTVEILEGLRTPDGGRVSVCGLDPQTSGVEYKYIIGAALQSTALPDKMRVREALDLFGGFYPRRRGAAAVRIAGVCHVDVRLCGKGPAQVAPLTATADHADAQTLVGTF